MPGSYHLTEEQEMIRSMARQMAKDRLAPRAAEIDRDGEFPWDILEFYRDNQILGMPIPEEYTFLKFAESSTPVISLV